MVDKIAEKYEAGEDVTNVFILQYENERSTMLKLFEKKDRTIL